MQFERMLLTHRNSASFWAHHGKGGVQYHATVPTCTANNTMQCQECHGGTTQKDVSHTVFLPLRMGMSKFVVRKGVNTFMVLCTTIILFCLIDN